MPAEIVNTLIQTKLHQPRLPVDLVPRPRLTNLLNPDYLPPVILISAPAGSGKSTLAKSLAEATNLTSAWIQLDEHDNQLSLFLDYFLSAIDLIHPGNVAETKQLVKATPLPQLHALSTSLINELNQIEQSYLLVLDDYQSIHNPDIHDFIDQLLLHPPPTFHFILSTRIDPPLSLTRFRLHSKVFDFRAEDLRFNLEETQQFLQNMMGVTIDDMTCKVIEEQTEGWVTGIRLAALAMRHRIGREAFHGTLSPQNRYLSDYLIKEILAKQTEIVSDCMLKISIVDRFCAELCQAICFQRAESTENYSAGLELNGNRFMTILRASDLFVIQLDDNDEWFRYHHLFQDFIRQELVHKYSRQEILNLHDVAGRWFEQNGWLEEALYHYLEAENQTAAIEVISKNRYTLMNKADWPRLENWLNLFSNGIVESSSELWMTKIWLVYHQARFSELPGLLQQLAGIMAKNPDRPVSNSLVGEISALRSLIAYFTSDAAGAISLAREALRLLDPELWIVRVMARMYLGGSMLLLGDTSGGFHAFYDAFDEEKVQNTNFKATLLMTACNFHWVNADLQTMAQAAKQCIVLCGSTDIPQILGYGKYQLGRVYYQQNNLTEAAELFASVAAKPYQNYGVCYANSVCGLSLTYQVLGKERQAQEVLETAIAYLLETSNTSQLPYIMAMQANLALLQGKLSTASQWVEQLKPIPPLLPESGFLVPHLILVKLWLAQNTPDSLENANKLLGNLHDYYSRTHNSRFLIETLALQALLNQALGNHSVSLSELEQALRLAQPGGFIRLFVDLGPQMAQALSQLQVEKDLALYIKQILSAFHIQEQRLDIINQENIIEPLTNRELQILELLSKRMSNKEIASQLGISPGTIKGHTIHIYDKLDVSNRRQAVEKAIELGILSPEGDQI